MTQADAAPPRLADDVTPEDHALGPGDAPLTLVEYGDYECPSCTATHPIVAAVRHEFGDRMRFVFRHFPVTSIHPRASLAAQAAEAAGAQGRFWDMHDLLYRDPGQLADSDFDRLAIRLGLEVYRFERELTSNAWAARVERQAEGGRRSGVRGTPTFFLNGLHLPGVGDSAEAMTAAIMRFESQVAGSNN